MSLQTSEDTSTPSAFDILDTYGQWELGHGSQHSVWQRLRPDQNGSNLFMVTGLDDFFGEETKGQRSMGSALRLISGDALTQAFLPPSAPLTASEMSRSNTVVDELQPHPEPARIAVLPLSETNLAGNTVDPDLILTTPAARPITDASDVVITAIIDNAINIAHERFFDSKNRSRIDFAWIQDADGMDVENASVTFGHEWTGEQIEAHLQAHEADFDRLMQALKLIGRRDGLHRPSSILFRSTHGTCVSDLAAGSSPERDMAEANRIIAVQLPVLASLETSGFSLVSLIVTAAEYVFDRAFELSRAYGYPIPLVLNISYAFDGGPRHGLNFIEKAIGQLKRDYRNRLIDEFGSTASNVPLEVVLPVGNRHLARSHSRIEAGTEGTAAFAVPFRLQPDDQTSTFVEVWFPDTTTSAEIQITAPDGTTMRLAFDGSSASWSPAQIMHQGDPDFTVARLAGDSPVALQRLQPGDDRFTQYRALLAIAPTHSHQVPDANAPAGAWKLHARAEGLGAAAISAWIMRDETVAGISAGGRQAYFGDDAYEADRYLQSGDVRVSDSGSNSVIRRDGTASAIATGRPYVLAADEAETGTVCVGGYRADTGGAAVYSAAAVIVHEAPLIMGPTDASRTLSGVLGAGTRNGTMIAMNGTSVAAPQVARLIADNLADRHGWATFSVPSLMHNLAVRVPRPTPDEPETPSSTTIRENRVRIGCIPPPNALRPRVARGRWQG